MASLQHLHGGPIRLRCLAGILTLVCLLTRTALAAAQAESGPGVPDARDNGVASTSGYASDGGYCETDITSTDGKKGTYRGQCRKGVPHGQGAIHYLNGDKYSGFVADGLRQGEGAISRADGSMYTGEWHNDRPHGRGTEHSVEWGSYNGHYTNGEWDGQGVLVGLDGARYQGQFKGGAKHGRGTLTTAAGNRRVGIFKDDRFWDGDVYFANGTICPVGNGRPLDAHSCYHYQP